MLIETLRHTPPWVAGLLLALLYLGYAQSRERSVPLWRVTLLPVAMLALSLNGVVTTFGLHAIDLLAWGLGWAAALAAGALLALPTGIARSASGAGVRLPGSWWPLVLMLGIFFIKYAVTVALVRTPQLASQLAFAAGASLVYGLLSGAFFARALRVRQALRAAPAPSFAS